MRRATVLLSTWEQGSPVVSNHLREMPVDPGAKKPPPSAVVCILSDPGSPEPLFWTSGGVRCLYPSHGILLSRVHCDALQTSHVVRVAKLLSESNASRSDHPSSIRRAFEPCLDKLNLLYVYRLNMCWFLTVRLDSILVVVMHSRYDSLALTLDLR
jgi:hypothetical protein